MAGGGWRYIAQRVTSFGIPGEFLDFNLPLQGANIDEVLSGHNGLTGSIAPEVMRLKGPDGRPILEEWGACIWAEDPDGEIRGGGIVNHATFEGPLWNIECIDISGMLDDLPYVGEQYWINIDALDMFREVWRHAMTADYGRTNFGITIDSTMSGKMLGGDLVQRADFDLEPDESAAAPAPIDPAEPASDPMPAPVPLPVAESRYANNAAWRDAGVKVMKAVGWNGAKVDKALGKWLNKDTAIQNNNWDGLTKDEQTIKEKTIDKIGLPPNPPLGTQGSVAPSVVYPAPNAPTTPPPRPVDPEAPVPTPAAEAQAIVWEHDPFKLVWHKDHNLAATVDDLSASTPFDWHMTHRWNGEEIAHHIRIGYPKLGRRRDELRFVIGENIKVIPSIDRDGTRFANEILFLGAGEGSAQVVARDFRRDDGRVRRVAVISDPSVQDHATAQQRARDELNKRFTLEDVTSIILSDHPHAPMGSVDLGDEILIEGETGWLDLEVWVRVIGRTFAPDSGDSMTLTVVRSDRL